MTQSIYGSHEVKECFGDVVHGLFEDMMAQVEAGLLDEQAAYEAMKIASDHPGDAYALADDFHTTGEFHLGSYTAKPELGGDPAVAMWEMGRVALGSLQNVRPETA